MSATNLKAVIQKLSQGAVESVQSGSKLDRLSDYMHIVRPIERQLMEKMQAIENEGGGIVLLIGSAGDGKSHLISCVKKAMPETSFFFYNDATASASPKRTAIETLKEALVEFKDASLAQTHQKLVLAINMGKLIAFVDDQEVQDEYKELVKVAYPVIDDDDLTNPEDTYRVKTVLFPNHQIFEIDKTNVDVEYPVNSVFLSSIFEKIVNPVDDNPFYLAYKKDISDTDNINDPVILNYYLLCNPSVRATIVKYIIEAIVRFRLIITPREFLDFVYNILVYPRLSQYKENRDFYDALLPNLLFCGGDNRIQKAMSNLDPIKSSSTEHDKMLSLFFTSYSIPDMCFPQELQNQVPDYIISRTNKFYQDNGRNIEATTQFLFRLMHLFNYESENDCYKSYLKVLQSVFRKDISNLTSLFKLVATAIPRHYGSYYSKNNMIPLSIQGGNYKLFAKLSMKPKDIIPICWDSSDNEFLLNFIMKWNCDGHEVKLPMNFQLYEYISKLGEGRLAISYDNDKDIAFSRFVRELSTLCTSSMDEVIIVAPNGSEKSLSESLNTIQLL